MPASVRIPLHDIKERVQDYPASSLVGLTAPITGTTGVLYLSGGVITAQSFTSGRVLIGDGSNPPIASPELYKSGDILVNLADLIVGGTSYGADGSVMIQAASGGLNPKIYGTKGTSSFSVTSSSGQTSLDLTAGSGAETFSVLVDPASTSLTLSATGDTLAYDAVGHTFTIRSVPYTWPAADGIGALTSDGSGNLSWGGGGGAVTGSGASGQVTYWNGTSSITGDNGLVYTPGSFQVVGSVTDFVSSLSVGGGSSLQVKSGTHDALLDVATSTGSRVMLRTSSTPDIYLSSDSGDTYAVYSSSSKPSRLAGAVLGVRNVDYTWPASQGGASTVLTNNGSGGLTWAAASTGTVTGTGSANRVAYWSGASALTSSSTFVFDGTSLGIGTASPADLITVTAASGNAGMRLTGPTGNYQACIAGITGGNGWSWGREATTGNFYLNYNIPMGTGTTNVLAVDQTSYAATFSRSATSSGAGLIVQNTSTSGTTAQAEVALAAYDGSTVSQLGFFGLTANSWTFGEPHYPQMTYVEGFGTGGLLLETTNASSGDIIFNTAGYTDTSFERMRLSFAGSAYIWTPTGITPTQYRTGTASQSGTTITGIGTTFTSGMVGSYFVFDDGGTSVVSAGLITAFTNTTTLTVSGSATRSARNYRIVYPGVQVDSTGKVGIGAATTSDALNVGGNVTATSYNKMAITAPATSSTLAVADGKTLTANASITMAGTDGITTTFPPSAVTLGGFYQSQTGGGTATITFSSIPGGFRVLKIYFIGRDTKSATAQTVSLKVNGDATSGNYASSVVDTGNGTTIGSSTAAASASGMALMSMPGATATASYFSQAEITIVSYAGTTAFKTVVMDGGVMTGSPGIQKQETVGVYKGTGAITQIDLITDGTAFASGTIAYLILI